MKIGLLTFHTSANYGAVLQAFALQHFIERQGYNTEYLDYQNHCRRMFYDIPYHVKTLLHEGKLAEALFYFIGMPFLNWRKKKFESFRKQYLRISSNTWHTPEELVVTNDLYDKFVIGSDQVWNPKHNGSDTSFMLSFVKDSAKTIAYASSFGMSDVPDRLKEAYTASLNRICHLSTREQNGVDIIKSLTGRDALLALDPVFLLERETWLQLIGTQPNWGNYLFSYTNEKGQMRNFLQTTGYDMKGIKHHKLSRFTTISDFLNPHIKVKYVMSPIEFLTNINGARLVVSASFHCISFAIILNIPFICILSDNEGRNERLYTLLSHFGLTDRIFSKKMTLNDVQKPINWNKVNCLIEEKRKESVNFLMDALNSPRK